MDTRVVISNSAVDAIRRMVAKQITRGVLWNIGGLEMKLNYLRTNLSGADIWDNLWFNLGDNLSDNLWDNLWFNLRDNLRDNLVT